MISSINQQYWRCIKNFNYDLLDISMLNKEQLYFIKAVQSIESRDKETGEILLTNIYINERC